MSSHPLHVVVLGASGTMGRLVLEQANKLAPISTVEGLVRPGSKQDGSQYAGASLHSNVGEALKSADVLIDFSTPDFLEEVIPHAIQTRTACVIGTTGFDSKVEDMLKELSQHAPLIVASNFSLGVNLLFELAECAAKTLDQDFDLEVTESHHRRKKDAPSGTALSLGHALAKGRGLEFDNVANTKRQQHTKARAHNEIGFSSIRGGDIAGEHTAYLIGDHERIELTHRASDRKIFAEGALKAALFVAGKPNGRYTMRDVLGFSDGSIKLNC